MTADAAHSPIPTNASDHACIDLVNSSFTDHLGSNETFDRISSREWQRWFLEHHGLGPARGKAPIDDLRALRRDVRNVLERWSQQVPLGRRDALVLDRWTRGGELRQRVEASGDGLTIRQEPVARDWTSVLAAISSSVVVLLEAADPVRLKTCGNPACSWMFYDDTMNRSKRFCSTTPCGSLVRVRRFRERG